MKLLYSLTLLSFTACRDTHAAACPGADLGKYAPVTSNANLIPCQNGAGVKFFPPSGQPDASQIGKMCVSTACKSLVPVIAGVNPGDCDLTINGVAINMAKVVSDYGTICNGGTTPTPTPTPTPPSTNNDTVIPVTPTPTPTPPSTNNDTVIPVTPKPTPTPPSTNNDTVIPVTPTPTPTPPSTNNDTVIPVTPKPTPTPPSTNNDTVIPTTPPVTTTPTKPVPPTQKAQC